VNSGNKISSTIVLGYEVVTIARYPGVEKSETSSQTPLIAISEVVQSGSTLRMLQAA